MAQQPNSQEVIPLAQPDIQEADKQKVLSVFENDRLALGPYLQQFEEQFAEWNGNQHGVGVSSGTAALHLCLESLLPSIPKNQKKSQPEVITTPLSFVSSTTTIIHAGARPVFVDIKPDSLSLNPDHLSDAITRSTAGILPVHLFGIPANMPQIMQFANQYDLFVLEDACEAPGATIQNQNVGTWADAATFAFYPNKQMTTGEGGVITTDDNRIARDVQSLRNQGRDPDSSWLRHDKLGYNYRMSELQAALGVSQLQRLSEMLDRRTRVASMYKEKLENIEEVSVLPSFPDRNISWFVFVVFLDDELNRTHIRKQLENQGIQTGTYFPCIHKQPFFQKHFPDYDQSFPVAEHLSSRSLALPFFNKITEDQIETVINALKQAICQDQ